MYFKIDLNVWLFIKMSKEMFNYLLTHKSKKYICDGGHMWRSHENFDYHIKNLTVTW